MARILIIDDDESVRTASKKILEANGFDVVAVADGASGVNAIRDQQFDLVIVDLFMPGMNGLDTTKAIRKLNRLVPIIAASGFMFGRSCPDMPNFEAMVMEAGATSALYKPFRPKELVQAIEKAIGVTNSEAPLPGV
jgi:CheY-like chemotaxis protein